MEASTVVSQMLSGNKISVPAYQRAYSWGEKQTSQFLTDLKDYLASQAASNYYFGHFLFEDKGHREYAIIDGQQRLTTITIFLAAIYRHLEKTGAEISEEERLLYNEAIKVGQTYRFSTVDYDNQLFRDYVINGTKNDRNGLETESQKRIADAYDYFAAEVGKYDDETVRKMLAAVADADCTTHTVRNEAEAIQMFIFQNNRGKRPSNLEIIKAQFLYCIHLNAAAEDKEELIKEVRNHFEDIYRFISRVEGNIDEDDVLAYTLRVYFNNLKEGNAMRKIGGELAVRDTCLKFISNFTLSLANSFTQVKAFFDNEKTDYATHCLRIVGQPAIMFPFVIKAYSQGVSNEDFAKMAKALTSMFLRNRVIGTRAVLTDRLSDVFREFSSGDVSGIVKHIEWLKTTTDGWWDYWNDRQFRNALEGNFAGEHSIAKIILWLYENHLIRRGKAGYGFKRYGDVESAQCEHIAPATEDPDNGYCPYDQEFYDKYLDCLGNYLLLSGHHNESIGNIPFEQKRETYTQLLQQQEVRDLTENDHTWDKQKINIRKEHIIGFVMSEF